MDTKSDGHSKGMRSFIATWKQDGQKVRASIIATDVWGAMRTAIDMAGEGVSVRPAARLARRLDSVRPPVNAPVPPSDQRISVPDGYVGPVTLRSGRDVYWTGKVAIGLRHNGQRVSEVGTHGWLQGAMLGRAPA